jgi:hypothetical protein
MSAQKLKIVFKHRALAAALALSAVQKVFQKCQIPLTDYTLDGEPVDLSTIIPDINTLKPNGFDLVGDAYVICCGSVGRHHLDFLEAGSVSEPPMTWDQWVSEFLTLPGFVMAWVVDSEYDHWQNAQDQLEYKAAGRSCADLALKSNGLPFPLEQQIIDTSSNPGRWIFCDGYIEAVGAVMWLGKLFWPLARADQRQVENLPWLRVSRVSQSVIRIQAAEQCFTTSDGSNGALQDDLRLLLFGNR